MSRLWIRNGKFVSDENGRPIVCPICPCVTCDEKVVWLQHLATVYGGTFYGEGYIRTPDVDGLVAPETQVFQAAVVYTITVNDIPTQHIITVGCGDDCVLGKRVLLPRESYVEKAGVCDCPELASFIENAEFAGHEVFGESILFRANPDINYLNFQYIKVKACYIDTENAEWIYAKCDLCAFVTAPLSYNRADFSCGGCVDVRKLPFPGFVAEQYGSHTCYSYTLDGAKVRRLVSSGMIVDNGGGYVDFRTLIRLYNIGGKRYLVEFWNTDDPDDPIDIKSYEVPKDTVLDGYANLLAYSRDDAGNIEFSGPVYGIPGDTYGVYIYQEHQFDSFYTEADAIAFSLTISTQPLGAAAIHNYYQHHLESVDKRSADCVDLQDIPGAVTYYAGSEKPWWAANIAKYGVTYSLRALRTNRGFLMLDGTYLDSLYIPTLAEVKACADYIQWEWEHSTWDEGETLVIDEAGKEDNVCKELDTEEFE